MTTVYNKLVRARVLEILDAKGIPYVAHIATPEEYREKLYEKLLEEATELAQDRTIEELADVLEVIEAIKYVQGWTSEEVEVVRRKKHAERGGFDQPLILDES